MLLALFAPRHPLPYKAPQERRGARPLEGMAQYVQCFTHPSLLPALISYATPDQLRAAKKADRAEKNRISLEAEIAKWDPKSLVNLTENAYKTLFIGRLSFDATVEQVSKEFEHYGAIKNVHLVKDSTTGKPRGYGFIEFEHSEDLKDAYKSADGRKINGRRIVVDVERGRTVANWKPRRLGGGLGGTRIGTKAQNSLVSGREPVPGAINRPGGGGDDRRSGSSYAPRRERSRSPARGGSPAVYGGVDPRASRGDGRRGDDSRGSRDSGRDRDDRRR